MLLYMHSHAEAQTPENSFCMDTVVFNVLEYYFPNKKKHVVDFL